MSTETEEMIVNDIDAVQIQALTIGQQVTNESLKILVSRFAEVEQELAIVKRRLGDIESDGTDKD